MTVSPPPSASMHRVASRHRSRPSFERNNLIKAQTVTVAAIEEKLPGLVRARDAVESFQKMLRTKSKDNLEAWIDRAVRSLVALSANGIVGAGP